MAELGCGGGRRETAGDLVGYAALPSRTVVIDYSSRRQTS